MKSVKAPEGYEGVRYYVDGAREWMASARPIGATWWTNCGLVGHTYLTSEELDARAERAIETHVRLRMVK